MWNWKCTICHKQTYMGLELCDVGGEYIQNLESCDLERGGGDCLNSNLAIWYGKILLEVDILWSGMGNLLVKLEIRWFWRKKSKLLTFVLTLLLFGRENMSKLLILWFERTQIYLKSKLCDSKWHSSHRLRIVRSARSTDFKYRDLKPFEFHNCSTKHVSYENVSLIL